MPTTRSHATETNCVLRRDLLRSSCFTMLASPLCLFSSETLASEPGHCTLGFSTYGMKSLSTERAISILSDIGYDAVELTVRSDWDADSAKVGAARRRRLRQLINQTSLQLTSLMEHVFPSNQQVALERLRLAAGMAHDIAPTAPPLVQTVLGSGDFEQQKNMLRDRLGEWNDLANETETTIAVKPHRGGVVSRPAQAVWLLEQLSNPTRLRMVYDFSHYAFRNLTLSETIQVALPFVSHIAVKDAVKEGERVVFKLPDEAGTIDFESLLRQFFEGGYRGDINCEVSGMVWNKPEYDPVTAASNCYRNMSRVFVKAGVPRPTSSPAEPE